MEIILEKLERAKKPLILAGHGIRASRHTKHFMEWIESSNIPVVTTQLARDLMPYDHSLYIGSPGVKGDRAGGLAIQNADVILILGCSLHPTTTGYELNQFAPHAYKMQVDIDEKVLRKNASGSMLQYGVLSSIQDFIKSLSLPYKFNSNWLERCRQWKLTYDLKFETNRTSISHEINYYDVIDLVSQSAPPNSTIIADAGSAYFITGQAFRVTANQRVILPGGLAQMGYATGAMIGACFAEPNEMVIGLIGDGSLMTNIHDLAVIAHHKLNAKIFLLNNQGYSCIRNTQDRYFKGHLSGVNKETGVSFPNFRQLAYAYGLNYDQVHTLANKRLEDKISQVLKSQGPILFEINTKKIQEIQPTVQSFVKEDGSMKSGSLDQMYPDLTPLSIKSNSSEESK